MFGEDGVNFEAFFFFSLSVFLIGHAFVAFDGEDDAHGVEVVDFIEGDAFVLHLLPAGVDGFDASFDFVAVAGGVEHLAERFGEAVFEFFGGAGGGGDFGRYFVIGFGVGVFHDQLFEFGFDVVETKPVGEGDVDVLSFAGDGEFLGVFHRAESAHVVEAVAEFEEDDVDVATHGEKNLAVVFSLFGFALLEFDDVFDFGDAVDDGGDSVAEEHADVVESDFGVFDDVVEECADNGERAEAYFFDGDEGDGEWVEDVGFAGFASGAVVGLFGDGVGAEDVFFFLRRELLDLAASSEEFLVFLLD